MLGLTAPCRHFFSCRAGQGVGQPGHDRHRLRGGERPVPQTILQRAAGRRAHVQRRPRRGAGPAAAFRALGGVGGVVLRVAEFDCVLQLVDPRVGEVGDLRDRQQVIAGRMRECGPSSSRGGKGG